MLNDRDGVVSRQRRRPARPRAPEWLHAKRTAGFKSVSRRQTPDPTRTETPRPPPTDEASEPYGTRTVTLRNEAGIVVVSLVLAWFCRLNSRSSSFRSSSALPVPAAASKAFMVGP